MAPTVKKKKKIIPVRPVPSQETKFYVPERDGVTFSLLSTFLDCREKARLYLQGWSGEGLSFALAFGGMAHRVLQRGYDGIREGMFVDSYPDRAFVSRVLDELEERWIEENPAPPERDAKIFNEALMKVQAVMPGYFRYYKSDFDVSYKRWVEVENTFQIPWNVRSPTGREWGTFLRGRIDGIYNLTRDKRQRPRILETKSRSEIDEEALTLTMPQERQSNTYLSAARIKLGATPAGVLLNIIRKPMLRQKQGESWEQFARRIEEDVRLRPEWYFVRMEMTVEDQEINRAEEELNDLISDFLLWWGGESGHYKNTKSCRMYNRLCEYARVCANGDYRGLHKRPVVFRELEDE